MSIEVGRQLYRSNDENPNSKPEPSQQALFSSFVSLSAGLGPSQASNEDDGFLKRFCFRDIGAVASSLSPLGHGNSFRVYVLSEDDYIDHHARYVFKRTTPPARRQNDSDTIFRNRIKTMMLELRTLAHSPIRSHENIVKLLGLAWETDPFDRTLKWPVFIMERATRGTLADLLQPETNHDLPTRLNLMLDTTMGLEALHLCGIMHGDIKLENVLVFDNPHDGRPFVAKLADFGGAAFDVPAASTLPSGTRPWNAPEWRDPLNMDGLLLTDIYSLGFTLWRILANGEHPFRDPGAHSREAWLERADKLKSDDKTIREHFAKISAVLETDMERSLATMIIDATLKKAPTYRNLGETKKLLMGITEQHPRVLPDFTSLAPSQYQLKDSFLPYSLQNMHREISPSTVIFISRELERAIGASTRPVEVAEAKYGLVELHLSQIVSAVNEGDTVKTCLRWLAESAVAGCDRARAVFYRCYRALDPSSVEADGSWGVSSAVWMLDAASKGHFQPLEDLRRIGGPDGPAKEALRTLRLRYGGTGSQTYDATILATPPLQREPWMTPEKLIEDMDHAWVGYLKRQDAAVIRTERVSRSGSSFLHQMACWGLRRTVSYLVNHEFIDINLADVRGDTPLLRACRSGHYFTVMELLEARADASIPNNIGETPLHWLLSFDEKYVAEVCQGLMKKLPKNSLDAVASTFAYIPCGENAFVKGTPLMRAVSRNRVDVVRALLDAGAEPLCMVGSGDSAPRLAAQLHYPHMLELLLSRVPRRALGTATDPDSLVVVMLASAIGCGSLNAPGTLFGRIRRHGAEWRDRARETLAILVRLCSEETPHWLRAPALSTAALCAHEDVVQFLLDCGGREIINEPAQSLLHARIDPHTPLSASIAARNFSVFSLLVQNGGDPLALAPGPTAVTLLYKCAQYSHEDTHCASALLRAGVQVDGGPAGYETPFACALRNRCFTLAEFLWEEGADVNVEYQEGDCLVSVKPYTILGHLIREYDVGVLACLRFLLCDRPGRPAPSFVVSSSLSITVLHLLAMALYPKQSDYDTRLLLGCVLDYFEPTSQQVSAPCALMGYSALHIAVLLSNSTMVEGLLRAGSDLNVKDENGYTPLDLASHVFSYFPDNFRFGTPTVSESQLSEARQRVEKILKEVEHASDKGLGSGVSAGEGPE